MNDPENEETEQEREEREEAEREEEKEEEESRRWSREGPEHDNDGNEIHHDEAGRAYVEDNDGSRSPPEW
jgi:hypothetical protein